MTRPFLAAKLNLLTAFALLLTASLGTLDHSRAMQTLEGETDTAIRIVHGIANAGPLDVYIDGSIALIGIVFAETSGDLLLSPGRHAFAVVPSGMTPEEAIAEGTITLQETTRYYAPLLGTIEAASVGLFAVDDREGDAGRARFRVISGVPDAGEIVPVFAGGDALSEPLQFGDASEYAAIDAGIYDLDLLDAASGAPLLALPQTVLNEGTATDIIIVGQVSDATMQALVIPTEVKVARAGGRAARVLTGTCADLGDVAADLGVVQIGQGEPVGVAETAPVAQGFGLAAIPFSTLTASPHVVAVAESDGGSDAPIACGAIGGPLTDTGALVIALQGAVSGEPGGVAVLAPALEDPQSTGVSVFLTLTAEAPASGVAATPEAVSG